MDRVISFPHLGNYYIVFDYFIRKATKCKVIVPPATTKRTIEITLTDDNIEANKYNFVVDLKKIY